MASVRVNAADWQSYLSSTALSVLEDGLRVLEDRKVDDSDRAAKAVFVLTAVIDNVRWLSNSQGQVNKAVADKDADWNTFKQEAFAQIRQARDVYGMLDTVFNTCYGRGILMQKERFVPVEAQLAGVDKSDFKKHAKTIMAEKLAYWLVDAVADELMSSVFNEYRPIIIKTVKYASSFLQNTLSFLTQINSIGGLSRAGYMVAGGYVVYGGAALMAGAAQAGAAPFAVGIAALTGAGAAASGLAASGVGPAILADGGMGCVLPSDFDGKVARNVGRVAGAGTALGAAAGLTAATTGGVVAASGATVYGGAAIMVSLAEVGACVGGGAAAGAVVIAAAPAVVLAGVGLAVFGLLRLSENDVRVLEELLQLGDMQRYAAILVKNGYKRRSSFKTATEKQLLSVPVTNFAHRKKLLLLSEYATMSDAGTLL